MKTREELEDELGDWHATFPGQKPDEVCIRMGKTAKELAELRAKLEAAEQARERAEKACGELRGAIFKHLPVLKDMAKQVIPADNTFYRIVVDLEQALCLAVYRSGNSTTDYIKASALAPIVEALRFMVECGEMPPKLTVSQESIVAAKAALRLAEKLGIGKETK